MLGGLFIRMGFILGEDECVLEELCRLQGTRVMAS